MYVTTSFNVGDTVCVATDENTVYRFKIDCVRVTNMGEGPVVEYLDESGEPYLENGIFREAHMAFHHWDQTHPQATEDIAA